MTDLEQWEERARLGWMTPGNNPTADATYMLAVIVSKVGKMVIEKLADVEDTIRRNCT